METVGGLNPNNGSMKPLIQVGGGGWRQVGRVADISPRTAPNKPLHPLALIVTKKVIKILTSKTELP